MKALGLVGTNGAGKSTVCAYLKENGYDVYSLSDVLREILRKEGLDLTRDTMTNTANKLKDTHGLSVFAQKTYDKAIQNNNDKVVFDSVRNLSEIEFLKNKGVAFIGVDAPIELRYERIKKRKRETDFVDFKTFQSQDDRENTGISSGQHIHAALKECQVMVENKGSEEDFLRTIEIALKELGY
jgi:dephospho-CoA kinase